MLILNRKPNQSIIIDGNIEVKVLKVWTNPFEVRLGIEAPKDVTVNRLEVEERIKKQGSEENSK
jgi:carbon storage regulator